MTDSQRRTQLTRYLLGQVSPEERDEIEQRYLREDDLFEEMFAAESDLLDDYARGRLAEPDRSQVEAQFSATPERRDRLQFAIFLAHSAAASAGQEAGEKPARPRIPVLAPRLAFAAALLILVAGLAWLAGANLNLRRQLQTAHSGQADAEMQLKELNERVANLQGVAAASKSQEAVSPFPVGSQTLSAVLEASVDRGNAQQITLQLSSSITKVLLLLRRMDAGSSTYLALLETAEGQRVWQSRDLVGSPAGKRTTVITVDISPALLRRNDYVLKLFRRSGSQSEELDDYSFRIIRGL